MSLWDRITQAEERTRDRALTPIVALIPEWIVPNHITGLRLALVLVAVSMHFLGVSLGFQIWVLTLAAITDTIDGPLARSRGLTDGVGAVLDHTVDWALGGWMGICACLNGLVSLRLAAMMIAPQLVVFAFGYHARPEGGNAGFVPSTPARLQFLTVIGGFGCLLLGRATGQQGLLAVGLGILYLEIAITCVLAVRAVSVRLGAVRRGEEATLR